MFSGSINRSIRATERARKKLDEYVPPTEGERNVYEEGDPRQTIHKYTKTAVDLTGDVLKQTPEPIKKFGGEVTRAGGEILTGLSEMNVEARKTAPIGVTPLDLLMGVATVIDKTTKGVSQITGIDRPILDVGEMFIPYGKVFSSLKNAGKVKTVANVVDTASDLRMAEKVWRVKSKVQPGFNTSLVDFLGESGELAFLKTSKTGQAIDALVTTNKNIFEDLYPGKTKGRRALRERIFSSEGSEYRSLVTKHNRILQNVEPTMVDGNLVKISPIPESELIKDANRLITLKEKLNIPTPKVYQNELGAVIKDEHVARITGGQAGSDKIGQFQSTKPFYDRAARENLWPVEGDPYEGLFGDKMNPRRVAARTSSKDLPKELRTIEADHMNILETTTPWGQVKNTKGEWVPRSNKQLLELRDIMKSKYNIDLGNINENWMMASTKAHRTGDLAKHVTLGNVTDFQKPLVYADADKIQVVLKNGKTKWLTQTDGQLFDGKTLVKETDYKKKLNLQVNGRTYTPKQKHGASLELQDTLAAITDTEELADAMKLFMIDSGANEVMAGATVLSSYAYDSAKHLDPLTLKLRKENIPAMLDYIDLLLNTTQYKGHRVLHDLKEQFTNRMKLNMAEYKEQLRLRS